MADLADKIDDLICTFDGTLNATVDMIAMYSFGVFVFVFLVFVIACHLWGKYRGGKSKASSTTADKIQNVNGVEPKSGKDSQKNIGSLGASKAGVPSTPTTRKRLGSKSGKIANIAPTKPKSLILPPPATGSDAEAVKWVNDLFFWLYSDMVVVNELVNLWIQSLNESMKPSVAEHGVGVELIRMLPETHPPTLNNIFCECMSNDDMKITCDCDVTPAMQLKAFRQRGDKVEVSHYRVNVNKFRSRLNLYSVTEKLHVKVKFDGWPEIKILLAQVGSLKNNNLDELSLQEVIIDIVTSALRNTNIDFNLSGYTGCPRLVRRPVSPSQHLPLHYDSMLTSSNSNVSRFGEKLIVKILKGTGLVSPEDGSIEPFCMVEIDNPPQTNQTAAIRGTGSPNWNEQFVFNINPRTKEILFEVYGKSYKENEKNKFLGLAIVSVQELLESPSQRQVISLQARPYQNDKVTGSLTLEFMFVDCCTEPFVNGVRKGDEKSVVATPNKSRAIMSKSGYANPLDRDYAVNGVTEKSSNDVDSENRNAANTISSKNSSSKPQSLNSQQDSGPTNIVSTIQNAQNQQSSCDQASNQQDIPDSQQNGDTDNNRGRSRRRRDFFGTIRRRLNRSRGRAKSVERNGFNGDVSSQPDANDASCNSPASRSASADRTRDHSAHSVHSTVGPLPREGSARSSLSEMSGVSGASSRTYLNEASTLVLETVENGIKKYYLVPLSLAQKNKWKKKGTKLHIYNEHTFVAKHLPGGTSCQICNRTLPRRLGKQGYECRDCQLKCHKQCHVRTDSNCPSSTVQNLELSGSLKIPKIGAGR